MSRNKVTVTIEIHTLSDVDIPKLNKVANDSLKKLMADSYIIPESSTFSIRVIKDD